MSGQGSNLDLLSNQAIREALIKWVIVIANEVKQSGVSRPEQSEGSSTTIAAGLTALATRIATRLKALAMKTNQSCLSKKSYRSNDSIRQ